MIEKIEGMKEDFVEESKNCGLAEDLSAIFTIGSVSNADTAGKHYQDFDIHFLFPRIEIPPRTLEKTRNVFETIKHRYTDSDTAVDFAVVDRPWKMPPEKEKNIGLHGTILNALDFTRREQLNPVIGRNMWDNSQVLYGSLEYERKEITAEDLARGPGGTGWLKELFYRFLPHVDLDNEDMLPIITDVCYYFGQSPLLHFHYMQEGHTASRAACYDRLMDSDVSGEIKDMVAYIKTNQHTAFPDKSGYERMLDSTISVLNYFHNMLAGDNRADQAPSLETTEELSDKVSDAVGRDVAFKDHHFIIEDGTYREIKAQMDERMASIENPRTYDFMDAMGEIISGAERISRAYFWTPDNLARRASMDFEESETAQLHAWETGLTTFIQRMHEMPINREESLPLAQALSSLCTGRQSTDYFGNLNNLYEKAHALNR